MIFSTPRRSSSIAFASEKKDNPGLTMDEMNDVNDFMEKFGDDFELKWGLAIDPELGSKVKVTVLATGFGLEDVEGMNRHLKEAYRGGVEKNCRRGREDEPRTKKEESVIMAVMATPPNISAILISSWFKPEDLDNEDIILQVEGKLLRRREPARCWKRYQHRLWKQRRRKP